MSIKVTESEKSTKQDVFWSRTVDEYYERLFKYALLLSGSYEDAQDLVQETFLTASSKAVPLMEHPSVYGWLRTTLYHHFQRWQDKQYREHYYRCLPDLVEMDGIEDLISQVPDERDEMGETLLNFDMQRMLTKEEYYLVRRVYFKNETVEEAARDAGLNAAVCRKRLQRIREKLRKKYPR